MTRVCFKLITFLCISIGYVNISNAEPISFKSVNMTMTIDEMLPILSKDMKCEKRNGGYLDCKHPNEDSWRNTVGVIMPPDTSEKWHSIDFTCTAFNGCSTSFDDVLSGISNFVGFALDDVQEISVFSSATVGYCGYGADGDRICVTEDKEVSIQKGTLGTSGGGMKMN